MIRKFSPWIIPGIFIGYILLSFGLLWLLNFNLPSAVEKIISILILPFFYIFYPFYPVLKKFGMLEGEFWRGPSLLGYIFVVVVYAIIFYCLGLWIRNFGKRKNETN